MPNGVRPQGYPGVPTVVDDRVLAPAVRELTAIVELLTGQRGDGSLAVPTLIKQIADLQRRVTALEP
jgi:hypothetical protein